MQGSNVRSTVRHLIVRGGEVKWLAKEGAASRSKAERERSNAYPRGNRKSHMVLKNSLEVKEYVSEAKRPTKYGSLSQQQCSKFYHK